MRKVTAHSPCHRDESKTSPRARLLCAPTWACPRVPPSHGRAARRVHRQEMVNQGRGAELMTKMHYDFVPMVWSRYLSLHGVGTYSTRAVPTRPPRTWRNTSATRAQPERSASVGTGAAQGLKRVCVPA